MDRANNLRLTMLLCALLSIVTLAAYWSVWHNDFVHYDDTEYVTENIHVVTGLTWANITWAFQSGHASNWHPLTWLSHMLDVQLLGLNAAAHHLTSLLFHLANTLLLFFLLRRMTGAVWRSAFVAALFAVHPLHVESVAWVAERKDVLSTFFFMLTLWAYARYAEKSVVSGQWSVVSSREPRASATEDGPRTANHGSLITGHRSLFYLLSLAFFACGLMSKAMLVTLPFLLLLLDFWPLQRFQPAPSRLKPSARKFHPSSFILHPLLLEKFPFLALAAASSAVTFLVQQSGHATAIGFPLGPRLANAVASYLKYLGKTVWPVDLAVFYPHPDLRYPISNQWPLWQILLVALLLAAVSGFALVRLRREPWFATGWFWYLGTLVPVIGIVQVGGQAMADRYTYIPLIGIFICLVWGAAEWGRVRGGGRGARGEGHFPDPAPARPAADLPLTKATARSSKLDVQRSTLGVQGPSRARVMALAMAGVLVLVACVVLTRTQVSYWRNDSILFAHALAVIPNNPMGHNSVGCDLVKAGKYELALSHFRAAVEADPTYAEAQCSLGYALNALGKVDEAVEAYRTAVGFRPWHAPARASLGALYGKQGKRQEALQELGEALRYNPDSPDAHYNLGIILLSDNQFAEAAAHLARAARVRPSYDAALSALGRALAAQGKFAEAQAQFREVVRLCPTNAEAHVNLGNTLTDSGQTNEAAACFATALRLEPDLAGKKVAEGKALLAQGQAVAAFVCFTIAARLQPASAEARENLGLFYAQQGKLEDAIREFQEQLRLQPDASAHYNLALGRVMQGNLTAAAAQYEEAVKLKPDWPTALNDLAWLRATAPQAELRDGAAAVRLAERACELSGGKEARFFGTLDAAYAEAGRFDEAIRTAEQTRQMAVTAGDKEVAGAAEQRLALYQKRQPYRQ